MNIGTEILADNPSTENHDNHSNMEDLEKVKDLIRQGQLEEAIEIFKLILKDKEEVIIQENIILHLDVISSGYSNLKQNITLGILNRESEVIELNKVSYQLLTLVYRTEKNLSKNIAKSIYQNQDLSDFEVFLAQNIKISINDRQEKLLEEITTFVTSNITPIIAELLKTELLSLLISRSKMEERIAEKVCDWLSRPYVENHVNVLAKNWVSVNANQIEGDIKYEYEKRGINPKEFWISYEVEFSRIKLDSKVISNKLANNVSRAIFISRIATTFINFTNPITLADFAVSNFIKRKGENEMILKEGYLLGVYTKILGSTALRKSVKAHFKADYYFQKFINLFFYEWIHKNVIIQIGYIKRSLSMNCDESFDADSQC